jgi:hypothetical protein
LLATSPPYWQPALAGGAQAISPPAISITTSAATLRRFTLTFSAEHSLTVDIEQVALGATLNPGSVPTQRHRDLIAGVTHDIKGELDGFDLGEPGAHLGDNVGVEVRRRPN